MGDKVCMRCRVLYPSDARVCKYCGGELVEIQDTMFDWERYPYLYPRVRVVHRRSHLSLASIFLIIIFVIGIVPAIISPKIITVSGITNVDGIEGTVIDRNREPVPGVLLSVQGTRKSTISDPSGHFEIHGLSYGEYIIKARKEGYVTKNLTVFVAKPLNMGITIIMDKGDGFEEEVLISSADVQAYIIACITLAAIFSLFSLIGAYHTRKQKNFGWALFGGIFGVASGISMALLLGMLFALGINAIAISAIAIVIIVRERYMFERTLGGRLG